WRPPTPAEDTARGLGRRRPAIRAALLGSRRSVRQNDGLEESRSALRALPARLGSEGGSDVAAKIFELAQGQTRGRSKVQRCRVSSRDFPGGAGGSIATAAADGRGGLFPPSFPVRCEKQVQWFPPPLESALASRAMRPPCMKSVFAPATTAT